MKALTVKQPWAWAIAHGGKNVENRTHRTNYRGPVAIHAGLSWSARGAADRRLVLAAVAAAGGSPIGSIVVTAGHPDVVRRGAVIAVADLVGCHMGVGICCAPWGDPGVWHWELSNVRPLAEPVACKGLMGLWNPSADVVAAVEAGVSR